MDTEVEDIMGNWIEKLTELKERIEKANGDLSKVWSDEAREAAAEARRSHGGSKKETIAETRADLARIKTNVKGRLADIARRHAEYVQWKADLKAKQKTKGSA